MNERDVRKVVTVVFSDLVDSSRLSVQLDPEALKGLMSRYFEEMSGVVERHGGIVEKYIGDAVLAVFGIPVLHEDDALRAVRAAAEMREALEASMRASRACGASGSRRGSASIPARSSRAITRKVISSSPGKPSTSPSVWKRPLRPARS